MANLLKFRPQLRVSSNNIRNYVKKFLQSKIKKDQTPVSLEKVESKSNKIKKEKVVQEKMAKGKYENEELLQPQTFRYKVCEFRTPVHKMVMDKPKYKVEKMPRDKQYLQPAFMPRYFGKNH